MYKDVTDKATYDRVVVEENVQNGIVGFFFIVVVVVVARIRERAYVQRPGSQSLQHRFYTGREKKNFNEIKQRFHHQVNVASRAISAEEVMATEGTGFTHCGED